MMDMGLDEIIKNKKRKKGVGSRRGRPMRGGGRVNRPSNIKEGFIKKAASPRGSVISRLGVPDARLKIIQKSRARIKDARERLNEISRHTDARSKIMRKQSYNELSMMSRNGKVPMRGMGMSLTYDRMSIPRRTINNKNVQTYRRDEMLYRTVNNRGVLMPEDSDMAMDTMDPHWSPNNLPRLEVQLRNIVPPRPTTATATTVHRPASHPSSILRTSAQDDWLRPASNKQSLYRRNEDVKSRLEPARSSGISGPSVVPPVQEGFRIVVSNLQPTVTHEDIKELFEDIGTLIGSCLVRPGTAEVIYKTMDDAVAAVDTYHNRQLDGQPMKCMLVKPSNISVKGLPGKGSIVPDLHAIHKALFNK